MDKQQLDELLSQSKKITNRAYELFENNNYDSEYLKIYTTLNKLQSYLKRKELYILVAGEIKVGKSTFINSLLNEDVCESADEVCTNVPSIIKYGKNEKVLVHFQPNEKGIVPSPKEITRLEIPKYTTEKSNKDNCKSVAYLEIYLNNDILGLGLVLIDTPGLGSINYKHAVATFEVAQRSDIILFLGNTDKQLSSFEINSLKNLISVSYCKNIAHILTCCDRGDAYSILNANLQELKKVIPDYEILGYPISSINYQKYLRNKKEKYLDASGFSSVLDYIHDIGVKHENLLLDFYLKETYENTMFLENKLTCLKERAEDPQKVENDYNNLKICVEKLKSIRNNSPVWKESIRNKISALKLEIESNIERSKDNRIKEIKALLEEDSYLNNKEMLTSTIQAKLTTDKTELQRFIGDSLLEIYKAVYEDSGLTNIMEKYYRIELSERKISPIEISGSSFLQSTWNHSKNLVSGALLGSWFLGDVAASIGLSSLAAEIGGIIGSVFPGFGNLIGACGGALLGAIGGLIIDLCETKKRKRERVLNASEKNLYKFYNSLIREIQQTLGKKVEKFSELFNRKLKEVEINCQQTIRTLHPNVVLAEKNRKEITEMVTALSKINKVLKQSHD